MSDGMSDARYRAPSRHARFFHRRPHADDVRETSPAWPAVDGSLADSLAVGGRAFRDITERPGTILAIEEGVYIMVTRIFAGEIPQIRFIVNHGWGWRNDAPERMELHDYRCWIPGEARVVHDGCNLPAPSPESA